MAYIRSFIIDRVALAKQGDNRIGSVRPSVCVLLPTSEGIFAVEQTGEDRSQD